MSPEGIKRHDALLRPKERPDDAAHLREIIRHPTQKPVELMRYLIRLVTPPGGLVLDPFGGSGSTGEGAAAEGVRAILIERDPDYLEIERARCGAATAQPGLF